MKGSTRAATALTVGYLLGRRRKFRTAAVMAAATAVGGTSVSGVVMKRGMKMLGSADALAKIAPQLSELTETIRGDLVTAGKAAVTNAAAARVDALTDSIHQRAESLRNPGAVVAEGAERAQDTARGAGRAASSAGGRAASAAAGTTRRVPRQASADDEYEDYEQEEPEYDEADDSVGDDWDDTDDSAGDDRDDADDTAGDARDEYPADDADTGDERDAGRGRRAASGPKPMPGRSAPRRSPVTRTGR
jgi:hypothetical protein